MIAVLLLLAAGGFAVMVVAARRAAGAASTLAAGSRLPPFFVGMTLLAVGTDLPEIANSIIASATGHGDVNVGDSIGSAATQLTLILGLFPFIATGISLSTKSRSVPLVGAATAFALVLGGVLMRDGRLSRIDGVLLLGTWGVGSYLVHQRTSTSSKVDLGSPTENRARLVITALVALAVVGAGAALAVSSLVRVANLLDTPEFVIAFFVAAIGTSLPELVVDVVALRRGETGLALGGIFGASFIDATLSLGIGPLLFPTEVTAHLAVRGVLTALVAVLVATLVFRFAPTHNRVTGAILLVTYAAFFLVML